QPIETILIEGKHTIEVSKPGFETFKKEINVVADGRETVAVRLEPVEPAAGSTPPLIDTADPQKPTPKPTPQPSEESSKPEPTKVEEKEDGQTPKISWELRHTLTGHADEVTSVAFHPKGQMVISGSEDGTIRSWDVKSGRQLRFIQDIGLVRGLAVSPDGTLLAAVGSFLGAKLWNRSTGQPVGQFSAGQIGGQSGACNGRAVTFSPDGSMLAWCSGDVWLFNLRTKEAGHLPIGGEGHGTSIVFSGNGKLLACGSSDGSVRLWDTKAGKLTVPLATESQVGGGMSVAFANGGSHLVTGGHGNGHLKLWDVTNGDIIETFLQRPRAVQAIAVNPAKPILASAGTGVEAVIRVRDLADGQILAELAGHEDRVLSLVFSPDGKLLVSGGRDKTVRIWEVTMEE
ncbi:MAG: PD40 domain-containing protein, partial [Planctomycetes bacterium]|nr:PD40 domain-containing protein [Planctomycetota bacterium]